jgi:hypothetical protein
MPMIADDSIYVEGKQSKYDLRSIHIRQHWAALIPTRFVVQNAGNMGQLSAGIGWAYGKRGQWETDLLLGYIPKHQSSRMKLTMTLKENYIPWSFNVSRIFPSVNKKLLELWSLEPLTASVYLNTVYGHEFWKSQPGRYPDKYYRLTSTKFHLNIALGQRITFNIPEKKRRRSQSMSLFYEIGTCDLYIRNKIEDSYVPLKDIMSLSIGVKFHTL